MADRRHDHGAEGYHGKKIKHSGNVYIKSRDLVMDTEYVVQRDGVPYDCLCEIDNS